MKKLKIENGIRKVVNVPKDRYKGVKNINKGYETMTELHLQDGFLEIIKPTLTEFQRLDTNLNNGFIDEENGTFTYGVIKLPIPTDEELEIEQENDATTIQEQVYAGQQFYNKIKRRLLRKLEKGNLTQNQFDKLYTPFRLALNWCNSGDFDLALIEFNKIEVFNNNKLEKIRLKVYEELISL